MTIQTSKIDETLCVNYDRFQGVANIGAVDDNWSTLWETGANAAELVIDAERLTAEQFRTKYANDIEED